MKDKKFLVLIALIIAWGITFVGTAMGELKLNPNVERFATVIVLVYFAYWSYSALRWVKKPEPTEKQDDPSSHKCGCGCSTTSKPTETPKP
jgi:hypothetical protein